MSFGGITNFAKNALLTAQKHIDSALQIEEEILNEETAAPEDEEETEREDNIGEASTSSLYGSSLLHFGSKYDREMGGQAETKGHEQGQDEFLDVDLNVSSSLQSKWGAVENNDNRAVVDTEPNPIRDTHEPTNIFYYSPSSHSPDDDEGSQNGQSSGTAQINKLIELEGKTLNFEGEKEHESDEMERGIIVRGTSEKTLDRFEEVRTIASSDIEVIRQMDDWSITSSQNHHGQSKIPGVNLKEVFQPGNSLPSAETAQKSVEFGAQTTQEVMEQIALLTAKLKHRDQRIEELGRLNENLKQTNTNLSAKNKQRTSAEAKLQTQLTEKDRQLNDLLEEGKKLSEYSGRQAKEIRKLKQQLTQLEMVTAARDSAVEELQEAHQRIQENEAQIAELKDELERSEKKNEPMKTDLQKSQSHLAAVEKQLCEHLTQLEKANSELKRLEKEARVANRQREELVNENRQLSAKLMNKTAQERMGGEREQGILEDLQAERMKTSISATRIRELEQQLESIQDARRDIAVEISNANSPLLNTISNLEDKIISLERQNDVLSRSLRQTTEQAAEQKSKIEMEMELARKSLEMEKQNNAQREEEFARALREQTELQRRLRISEEEMASAQKLYVARIERLEQKLDQLETELKVKRAEIGDLQRKNNEIEQKMEMARKEQQLRPLPATNSLPIAKPIRSDFDGTGSVRVEFLQQKEQIKAHKQMFKSQKASSASSSPTNSQQRLELNLATNDNNTSDYTLDVACADHLRAELDSAQAQLFQLRERFDHLLELYGGCLESIEEIKEDNEDLRKLCKQQALRLSEMQHTGSFVELDKEESVNIVPTINI